MTVAVQPESVQPDAIVETPPVVYKDGYIPRNQRKKILLLSDDLRMPSGVGTMSKEIVVGLAHRYNWVQVGAAVQHPEAGKILDASESLSKDLGIPDAFLHIFPFNGYGDPNTIRMIMNAHKPDAIMIFTDPRFFIWFFQMEHEIRQHTPIIYYDIWDDLPYPKYNHAYYRSVDAMFAISKQTHNLNRQVLTEAFEAKHPSELAHGKTLLRYVPHGVDEKIFHRVEDDAGVAKMAELKKKYFGEREVEFVVLYNNRNIRRKMTGDVILAFREFYKSLPKEKAEKTFLLLHTQPVDENGTDLPVVVRDCAAMCKDNIIFSVDRVDAMTLNCIYNLADVVINLASNEGFGISWCEGLAAERMIISNVTGGLQDGCGFVDASGNYLDPDVHFNAEWGSNHDGRYKTCGQWCVPVFPATRSLIGSVPTPYIFDDRPRFEDGAVAIREVYDIPKDDRARRGALGRQYILTQGFTASQMCAKFDAGFQEVFENWKKPKPFTLVKS